MHKTDTMTEIRRLCRCGHSRHTPTGVCKDYDCGCIYFASIVNDDDTTTAPVPSGDAGSSLPVRDFLPAIGAHIPEPARFPSHADEVDYLEAVSEELRDLREQNIDGALALITLKGVISEALGYIGVMRIQNELGRLTSKQVDAMLFSLARGLRKALEA